MLVLTRKVGEEIIIGDAIRLIVVDIVRDRVRMGIQAPAQITVDRAEIHQSRAAKRLAVPISIPVADGKATKAMDNPTG